MPRANGFKSATGDLLKAAEQVGSAGRQLGALADEVQRTRQTIERSRRSSPIGLVRDVVAQRLGSKRDES